MSWLSDLFGRNKGTETTQKTEYTQMPEFAESSGARKDMYGKLQEWGSQPGYGAIPSNWDDLWGSAKNKVQQYYWGSPTSPGMIDTVKSKMAGQGMSGQPAELRSMARLGAEEAGQLSDIATQQAYAEAQESETGRRNWMSDLFGLAQLKPDMRATSTTQNSKDLGGGEGWGMLSSIGSLLAQPQYSLGSDASGNQTLNSSSWLDKLIQGGSGILGSMAGSIFGPMGTMAGGMAGNAIGQAFVGNNSSAPR